MRLSDLDRMEFEFKVEDADLSKLAELFADVNIKETPWFDVSDKHGNSARYYREGQWIPCSERLPDMHDEVLVTARGEVSIAWLYVDGKWRSNDMPQPMFRDIIAWKPLPSPYQPEEGSE